MSKQTTIELKKVNIFLPGSEETICFTCEIYVDGQKAGTAENSGHGGCTFYRSLEGKKGLIKKAESFCASLPDMVNKIEGLKEDFVTKMDLEHFIDNLIDEEVIKKEQAKADKRMNSEMKKYLLFTSAAEGERITEYETLTWKKFTIAELCGHPKGLSVLEAEIVRKGKEGKRCINTNLPANLLKINPVS